MAAKSKQSGLATLLHIAGFLFAVLLVLHAVIRISGARPEGGLGDSVARAAEPLSLFFPGLIEVGQPQLQVLVDHGLAAVFWVFVFGLLARVFR